MNVIGFLFRDEILIEKEREKEIERTKRERWLKIHSKSM